MLYALTVSLAAQDPAIRTDVPLVLIPAAVVDRKGKPVDGLSVEDFVVTDDGVRQNVRMDTSDAVLAPVSLVVAVESNEISTPALARIRRVGAMIQPLITGENGRAAVVGFNSEVTVLQEFTGDSTRIRDAFAKLKANPVKDARLIDTVAEGVRMLQAQPEGSRRIMLIIGESRDRNSKMKLAQALELAQRAGVTIYAATYSPQKSAWVSPPQDPAETPTSTDWTAIFTEPARLGLANDADAFAAATGGRHLSFLTLRSLEQAISKAGEEIHSQYLLSFAPAATANTGFHRVDVTVPSKKDAVVRARPGYWGK